MAIELKWLGTRPDLSTYDPELDWHQISHGDVDAKEDFFITVEGRHLKTLEGGTLDLSYNLLSDEDGEIVRRASRHAALLNVGEAQLELVKPIVLGEADGILEPNELSNGISKVTCPNPVSNPSKAKDVVTWQLRDAAGALIAEDSKTLNALSAGKDVDFPLNAAFVQQHFEARRHEKLSVSYNILRFETGRTSYSNPLTFLIGGIGLDLTTFDNGNWNEWARGEATHPSDWTIKVVDGNWFARNYTHSNNSAGTVLQKQFLNLQANSSYSFTINYRRIDSRFLSPSISLSANGVQIAGPVTADNLTWESLSGTFVASTPDTTLTLVSHLATSQGNDYEIDNIEVKII